MIEINLTSEIRPILEPFLIWVKAFHPDYKVPSEQNEESLKNKRHISKDFLRDGKAFLNASDVELLLMLLNCAARREPMDVEIVASYIESRNCVVCGRRYKQHELVNDSSCKGGRKRICKSCFKGYIRKKYHGDVQQSRLEAREKQKKWYSENLEKAREQSRRSSVKYRVKKREM